VSYAPSDGKGYFAAVALTEKFLSFALLNDAPYTCGRSDHADKSKVVFIIASFAVFWSTY
jgi:hypothetical protein